MMQTSQPFIATQQVSLKAYQRLRATLIEQSSLFDSVMTEAQFEAVLSDVIALDSLDAVVGGLSARKASSITASSIKVSSQTVDSRLSLCFVLMRSPTLSVLLTATPLLHRDRIALKPPGFNHRVNVSALASPSQPNEQPNKHGGVGHQYALSKQSAQNDPSSHLQVDIDSIASRTAQSQLHSEQAARSAAFIQESFMEAAKERREPVDNETLSSAQVPDYEVNLSFDEQAIASFISQLTPNGAAPPLQSPLTGPSSGQYSPLNQVPTPNSANKKLADSKALTQENFVLAWAKQLAAAPDGTAQATLDNQLKQSLLLNQVITRIRHSLDLPAILETTVAQVREFLSADRLVLYQFDQVESVDLSSPSSTQPFSVKAPGSETQSTTQPGPANRSETTDLHTNSDAIIGRCTHAGHITYESRLSESIPSVLNFSETACFMPSLSIRSRYIMGQPVAVDNVDDRYAHVQCLLDFLHQSQVKSKLIAPIIVQDQLWGLLIAHQCEDYRHWQETEVMFLQQIAEHLAVAISQSGLYQQLQKQTVSLESCVVERTQNLHDALLAAETANLTKGEFLSTMSHELRTPLTYIIGMSATLLRWSFGELSDRQRSYLNTINHSGEQLLEIINDILDFAKISSGRTFLDVSEFSLKSLVHDIMEHFQSIADKQEVALSLRFDIAPSQDVFHADTKRLSQIISNLIHNAIKFTPAGGDVTLRVSRDGQVGVFQVEDTGIGIPESQRGLLFEKFKQLESPFQRQYSGTGLGLAMTKRLVELHGGTIQVKSTVGQGSVFSVRLPLQTPELASDRYEVPLTFSDSSRRVLLLEVQENTAAIICDLLTADGYEVIWQENVEKMLPQLASLQPAILIADLSLLSHDLDEIKKVQLSITDIGTKVLALLGQPMSQSSHIAHHDTLEKPIDPKKLLEKVRQLTLSAV